MKRHIHLNAGATLTPGVEVHLKGGGRSDSHLLVDYRLGFSAIYLFRENLNFLAEVFAERLEGVSPLSGSKEEARQMTFSPGVRYAINFKSGAQMVLGLAIPLGLTTETEDYGVFVYLSFESALWKAD